MADDHPSARTGPAHGAATAAAKAEEAPCDRDNLVSDLRRRYVEGRYHVDAEALSSKIVDRHLTR
jgi:anti-sigma28 factor (negative regulator of flagellin synthesis)